MQGSRVAQSRKEGRPAEEEKERGDVVEVEPLEERPRERADEEEEEEEAIVLKEGPRRGVDTRLSPVATGATGGSEGVAAVTVLVLVPGTRPLTGLFDGIIVSTVVFDGAVVEDAVGIGWGSWAFAKVEGVAATAAVVVDAFAIATSSDTEASWWKDDDPALTGNTAVPGTRRSGKDSGVLRSIPLLPSLLTLRIARTTEEVSVSDASARPEWDMVAH